MEQGKVVLDGAGEGRVQERGKWRGCRFFYGTTLLSDTLKYINLAEVAKSLVYKHTPFIRWRIAAHEARICLVYPFASFVF
jgi:hypothetical protein